MSNLVNDLLRGWSSGYKTDLTVVCEDGIKFKVHSFILGVRCEVFKSMIDSDMKEKKSGIVRIEEFESVVIEEFLSFLYSDQVLEDSPNLCGLLKIGHLFQVKQLVDLCVDILLTKVSKENVIELTNLSVKYDLLDLYDKCINILAFSNLPEDMLKKLNPSLIIKSQIKSRRNQPDEIKIFTDIGEPETLPSRSEFSTVIKSPIAKKLTGVGLVIGEYKGQAEVTVQKWDGIGRCKYITLLSMTSDITSDSSPTPTIINLLQHIIIGNNIRYFVSVKFMTEVIRYKVTEEKSSVSVMTRAGEEVTVGTSYPLLKIPIVYLCDV